MDNKDHSAPVPDSPPAPAERVTGRPGAGSGAPTAPEAAGQRLLARMLERLFAAVLNGPSMNCRPHASRQRIDLCQLTSLKDIAPAVALRELLTNEYQTRVVGRAVAPASNGVAEHPQGAATKAGDTAGPGANATEEPTTKAGDKTLADAGNEAATDTREAGTPEDRAGEASERKHDAVDQIGPTSDAGSKAAPRSDAGESHADSSAASASGAGPTEAQRRAEQAWKEQRAVFQKLRLVAEDARTYLDDTGVHVLSLGFPVLSIPPGAWSGRSGATSRRILAPVAFVPVNITLTGGAKPAVELSCREDDIDRVVPNTALLAWLEQQTGKAPGTLFADEGGIAPWREIGDLVRYVARVLDLAVPQVFDGDTLPETLDLQACPRAEARGDAPSILLSAVVGLFPLSNEALIRDTQALVAGEPVHGPILNFLDVKATLDTPDPEAPTEAAATAPAKRPFTAERLVTAADPCQTRAVRLARESRVVVVHGPPGTGKSQTITNVIGNHLAAGERVLFVCDKRTALDVVANRLEHIGLGRLCAVIHDPQRDQRDLYRTLREQLEALVEARTTPQAERDVARLERELGALHDELTQTWRDLMEPPAEGMLSFHALVGEWLSTAGKDDARGLSDGPEVRLSELEQYGLALDDIFRRAARIDWARNPWAPCCGLTVEQLLARPAAEVRTALRDIVDAAEASDKTAADAILPLAPDLSLEAQAAARSALAADVERVQAEGDPALTQRWVARDAAAVQTAHTQLATARESLAILASGPLDSELAVTLREGTPPLRELNQQLVALDAYLAVARSFWGLFAFGRKKRAAAALASHGLALSPVTAARARTFVAGVRARVLVQALCDELLGGAPQTRPLPDDSLRQTAARLTLLLDVLQRLHHDPLLAAVRKPVLDVLAGRQPAEVTLAGLRLAAPRAAAVAHLEALLSGSGLFDAAWCAELHHALATGGRCAAQMRGLEDHLDTLEDVVRIRGYLATLPLGLQAAATQVIARAGEPEEYAAAVRGQALATEVRVRLAEHPRLKTLDGHRLETMLERHAGLAAQKMERVQAQILHYWTDRQRTRLLASTGSRLNSAGADLRRRLTLRGRNAMRLRQVVAAGAQCADGDPLFDLAPVWMASPETVAQIFPRAPLFDVLIFDESSQCRLEEALPVLTRGKRVVIAGDPKQLPPTRFFESAFVESEQQEIASDQDLFEVQQGEIQDLLGAALSLDVQQSYLDVHYRSRNADLIEFSNNYFYGTRLQPIPGHPANRTRFAPLTLYAVNGVYAERQNQKEAEQVVAIVRDLLRRATPPSIGIASFNITQRDLILEKLDDLAAEDGAFAQRLAAARTRHGRGSFEGLFVKNLENVQGDERDHIIISTTYGRDAEGRFYRRFGPLGMPGGGRRLNVLVTRAREEVHLVTSIPREVYTALPPAPPGQTPNGGWLLFAYLQYAERLADLYEQAHGDLREADGGSDGAVRINPTRYESKLSEGLARRLCDDLCVGSNVYWGNDAFMVDVALHHPQRADDVTVGVLCDWNRFDKADDPVEWEIFRTAILTSQGWTLHRAWAPMLVRDPESVVAAIRRQAEAVVKATRSTAPPHEA